MKLSDLKEGMYITMRNHLHARLQENKFVVVMIEAHKTIPLDERISLDQYQNNMEHIENPAFDIVRVYRTDGLPKGCLENYHEPIWRERFTLKKIKRVLISMNVEVK